MRIGIGVTTYNRPECLKECLQHICDYSDVGALDGMSKKDYWFGRTSDGKEITIYVATDTDEDRRGVAYRKNECLRALKGCDYVFLLDDDCHPIKDGWVEFFINSGHEHLLFLTDKLHNKTGVYTYQNCGGVFMFMTKECIEKVGAFNEKFELYGFEHAEYSQRIYKAGLTLLPYNCKPNTDKYLFAHDYSTTNHKSSITDEEKKECIKNNWDKFFNSEIKDIYLPL